METFYSVIVPNGWTPDGAYSVAEHCGHAHRHEGVWGGWEVRNLETDSLLWVPRGARLRAVIEEGKNE